MDFRLLGPLEGHVVSLLLAAPIVAALITFLLRGRGKREVVLPPEVLSPGDNPLRGQLAICAAQSTRDSR